jgi:hypothetical protein
MIRLTTQRTIAAVMIASAILVPAASAQASDGPVFGNPRPTAQAPEPPRAVSLAVERTAGGVNAATQSLPTSASTPSGGFAWGDAGVGAAAMLILVSLGAGAVVALRRIRGRRQPALTA